MLSDKTFGTIDVEYNPKIVILNSRLYISGISKEVGLQGDKTDSSCYLNNSLGISDIWMVASDEKFNILWDYSYGGTNSEYNVAGFNSILNGQLFFSGISDSDSSCDKSEFHKGGGDFWFCIVDSLGNKIFDKTFGSSGLESGGKVVRLIDGNFYAAGNSGTAVDGDKSAIGFGNWDFWVVKFESSGQKLWDKVYGGSGTEIAQRLRLSEFDIFPLDDGSFIFGGRSNSGISGNVTTTGFGLFDVWIFKSDSSGNVLWDKKFGGSTTDKIDQILSTNDGGYIFIGNTDSPISGTINDTSRGSSDVWVVKLDSLGNELWDHRYGGINGDQGSSIQMAPDGGYWISASTNSPAGNDISEPSYGGIDYWMLKIDSVGNKLWDKRFGGPGDDYASNFVIMPDSSIYLCGSADSGTSAVKTDAGKGGSDYWVVHFNYYNNSVGVNEIQQQNAFVLSPNPALDYIEIKGNFNADTEVTLFDLQGQVLQRRKSGAGNRVVVDGQSLVTGMYLIEVKSNKGRCIQKLIKR